MIIVKGLNDIPKETHFAVIIEKSKTTYTPGDERSQTNPGHGYPESWDTSIYFDIYCFIEQSELENWITYNNSTSKYTVMKCQPLKITKKVEIELK